MKHKFFLSLLLALVALCLLAQVPVTRNSTKPKAKPKTEQTAKPAPAKKKTNQVAKPSATKRTNSSGATSSVLSEEEWQAVIDSILSLPDLPTPTSSSTSNSSPQSISSKTFNANGVSFEMMDVKGGTFSMGATSEQGSAAYSH